MSHILLLFFNWLLSYSLIDLVHLFHDSVQKAVFREQKNRMVLDLSVPIAMIVVGFQYNKENLCRFPVFPQYLIVAGFVYLVFGIFRYVGMFLNIHTEGDLVVTGKRHSWILYLALVFEFCANLSTLIWGNVVLTEPSNLIWSLKGTYPINKLLITDSLAVRNDTTSEFYCHSTPLVFSVMIMTIGNFIFGMILVLAVFIGTISCFGALCCPKKVINFEIKVKLNDYLNVFR